MDKVGIGVIGGSGVYEIEGVEYYDTFYPDTPFGKPSDEIRLAKIGGNRVAFLPRHGRGHRFNPTHVPYQANIYALKMLGVRKLLTVSAVGSLKLEIEPLHMVVPDQVIDRTKNRPNTFFDPCAVHAGFAHPFCPQLSALVADSLAELGITVHRGGTYVCMEGPLFSTVAESEMHRRWDASVIGMTALPEAKLAREAEMAYCTIACSTDYDCWHDEPVTVEMVVANLTKNVENVKNAIKAIVPKIDPDAPHPEENCLQYALLTQREHIPENKKEIFEFFFGQYWNE
jgi:5'-methylthioadenosine phosphorylase